MASWLLPPIGTPIFLEKRKCWNTPKFSYRKYILRNMYQLPGCWRSDKRKNKLCVYKTPVISGDYERWEVSAFRNLGNRTEVNPHTQNQIQCQNIRNELCRKKKRTPRKRQWVCENLFIWTPEAFSCFWKLVTRESWALQRAWWPILPWKCSQDKRFSRFAVFLSEPR